MAEQNASAQTFPIVGIGASAGGLDALQRFLAVLPQDFGFALVFIQHLSSKHKNLLSELLAARRPSLVIQEISDGLKAQAGRLYLAPPGREVRLHKGIFQTTVHPEGLIHLPIDEFLASLAEDAAERSIAVIFSGVGTDGARGCQAVRTVGGTVFVQEPETAEYNSMPLAAIATGQADEVLSPEDIGRELLKVQGLGTVAASREPDIAPEEFDAFFRFLQEKTASRFNHYKRSVVGRRIRRRMYLHGLSSVTDYLDMISADDAEAAHLASDLMIGVTSFFRDRVAWKALNLEAIRKIADDNGDTPVRVWTPASATGEEAYSIAMMLLRELALTGKTRDLQVFATDVNDRALEKAREGKYPVSIAADVPQEYIQKYFTPAEDGNFLVINKDVRESVVFARQDLLTDPPFSRLDLIICRNFLIYLEPEAQEKSITLFHYALKEGGFLFLGNAETVGRKSRLFKSIGHKQCRIYRKLEAKPASKLPISVPYAVERTAAQPAKQAQVADQRQTDIEIVQEKLLEEYAPASVAIDQNYEIVYHSGPTNRYLRQPRGVPTQNLLELLPESLRSRIRGAMYRSGREDRMVAIRTSVAGDDNRKRQVSLRITKARENLSIVVFQEKGVPSKDEAAEQVDSSAIEETAIHQLESELSATRQDLQSHIEQLKSLNEELQSSNEELQAANEELETSREELQSLNEELITVNSQLQGKIEEQDETNNDLNNFLASTSIPTIFLDQQFRVKRFTPAMLRLIKLLPSDAGRPIVDMSQENLGPDLISDAQSVLAQLTPIKKEMNIGDTWYVRTTLPYRTSDNRIEGVVITYTDITELKRAEECSSRLASFPQLNPNPVIETDSSGKVTFSNPAAVKFLDDLGLDKGNAAVFLPPDMEAVLRDWDRKNDASLYREVKVKDRVFGETIHLAPQFKAARIYAYDITDSKRAEEISRRLAVVLQTTNDAVTIHDFEGNIKLWNRGAERTFGWTEAEALTMKLRDTIPAEKLAEALAYLERLRLGEAVSTFETQRTTKDGRVLDVELTPTVLADNAGNPAAVATIERDVTEHKRAEGALRESEERLKRAQEIAQLGSWELDLVKNVLTWSDEVYRIFGLKPQEFDATYEAFLEAIHPDDRAAVNEAYSGSLREGRDEYEIEHRVVRKATGEIRYVREKCRHLRDASGRIIRSAGMVHDVTKSRQAEEALRESEQRVRLKLDSILSPKGNVGDLELSDILDATALQALMEDFHRLAGIPIGILDLKGRVLVGVGWQDICTKFHRAHPDACRHCVESDLELTREIPAGEFRLYKCRNGMWDAATPLMMGGRHLGNLYWGQFFFEDEPVDREFFRAQARKFGFNEEDYLAAVERVPRISREALDVGMAFYLKFADMLSKLSYGNVKLARSLSELEALNREMESFIFSISHDLRAPLRSVSGFARIIREDYTGKIDGKMDDYLTRIYNGSERMSERIEALMHLTKLSQQGLERDEVNMTRMASTLFYELRERNPERDVEVNIAEGLIAFADPGLTKLVLSNLFENAWKFTSKTENARIEFGTLIKDGKTAYYVRDNGAGFDRQYADRMFRPFHRLHKDSEFPGTGIGLAIVERVIQRHGGTVWAEGECGKGATVYFTLG
jgi:two-component system CheB/CheR fusion protein